MKKGNGQVKIQKAKFETDFQALSLMQTVSKKNFNKNNSHSFFTNLTLKRYCNSSSFQTKYVANLKEEFLQ